MIEDMGRFSQEKIFLLSFFYYAKMVFMKDHKEIVKERVSTYIICLKWDEKYMPNILVLI